MRWWRSRGRDSRGGRGSSSRGRWGGRRVMGGCIAEGRLYQFGGLGNVGVEWSRGDTT